MSVAVFITDVYKYTEKLERKNRREVKTFDFCSFHYALLPPLHKTVVRHSNSNHKTFNLLMNLKKIPEVLLSKR